MAEIKPKESSSLRQPKPKKRLGLSVPPALRMPHDDLIQSLPSQTTQPPPAETATAADTPVAPTRDYTKVANSIRREAVPAGLFKGKSKQLYDVLYDLTRGAVSPKRKVRLSRPKLMKLAHIGSRPTFEANVKHLCAIGLLAVTVLPGEHEGNEYEVFIPEEVSMPSQTSQTSLTSHAQKLVRLVRLETSQTRHTLSPVISTSSPLSKTFFKTYEENIDDEAFAKFLALLKQANREVAGREPSASEADRWAEVAEVLVTELRIAAGRTTVSSVPAFLAEHLRRRLWKKDRRQIEQESAEGTADASSPPQGLDASQCPDCFGTGMFYPEGFDKGVARCRHARLMESKEGAVGKQES